MYPTLCLCRFKVIDSMFTVDDKCTFAAFLPYLGVTRMIHSITRRIHHVTCRVTD